MLVVHSKNRRPKVTEGEIAALLNEVSADRLRDFVEMISFPRHYVVERSANLRARDLLLRLLDKFGCKPLRLIGDYDNIVATTSEDSGPYLLLGAHYDSVPGCPGADDNASAVAVCLECARLLTKHKVGSTMIVLFNREEDGLLGSSEFVAGLRRNLPWKVEEAHIFEMVGYCSHAAGSQRKPPGLPLVPAPDVGDFLGLLANRHSNGVAEELLKLAATYIPQSPVVALKTYLGVEKYLGHLQRSDHAPFWTARIPAIMWTDTSEFRNPHYHQATDTPDSLDYDFMSQVTKLALARAVTSASR